VSSFVAAVDQGTTSTRCLVFDHDGRIVAGDQRPHHQWFPRPGWVEHDPDEILACTETVVAGALAAGGLAARDLAAVGIANQRETVVLWDRATGRPVAPAVVWQDTRTDELCRELAADGGVDRFRARTGLPVATYFSGPKLRWLLDADPDRARRARARELAAGTVDSWLAWHLTGGQHVTDVTNASRTLLADLHRLDWDPDLCDALGVPPELLASVRASSEVYGPCVGTLADGALAGVPLAGLLGDQHAALLGQACSEPGEAKNTYGTGCFLLVNTGPTPVASRAGLLTTLGYRLGSQPPVYALEGSIAVAGALVQWLRDNLGIIASAPEVEALAGSVDDSGDVHVVPAFAGLFAPHWRPDARGVIVGLTRFATKAHIARAALEAVAWQTREVLDAMRADTGTALTVLRVDGGMVANDLLMQIQADVTGLDVSRPAVAETTALGAAYAAGLAVGYWTGLDEIRANWREERRFEPQWDADRREARYARWRRAVERSLDWV
jgi:glycerol kinase